MGINTWWEFWFIGIPVLVLGGYAITWSILGVIMSAVVSLGSREHIIYIDQQLAKNLEKYYDENGYMRMNYQTSYSIGSRFINYCIAYPFIFNRVKTNSFKFKLFMLTNALGYWSYIGLAIFILLAKIIGIIP